MKTYIENTLLIVAGTLAVYLILLGLSQVAIMELGA